MVPSRQVEEGGMPHQKVTRPRTPKHPGVQLGTHIKDRGPELGWQHHGE